jgi:hypothetical protein
MSSVRRAADQMRGSVVAHASLAEPAIAHQNPTPSSNNKADLQRQCRCFAFGHAHPLIDNNLLYLCKNNRVEAQVLASSFGRHTVPKRNKDDDEAAMNEHDMACYVREMSSTVCASACFAKARLEEPYWYNMYSASQLRYVR